MTEEMKAIINAPEKHIAVNAYAGCTKSSTMLEYIKAHPNENITFLSALSSFTFVFILPANKAQKTAGSNKNQ